MMNFSELDVWQTCRALANQIYTITKAFPKDELFGLTNQIRRAAISVVSNIAEGCGRQHVKDSLQLFYIARGSLFEVEAQLYIALDQKYVEEDTFKATIAQLINCKKVLNGFINYHKSKLPKSDPHNTENG